MCMYVNVHVCRQIRRDGRVESMGHLESYFYSFMLNFKKVGEFCFVCLVNFEEKKMPIEPKLVEGVGGGKQCLLSPFPTTPTLRSTSLSWGSLKASLGDTNRYLGAWHGTEDTGAQEIVSEPMGNRNTMERVGNPTFVVVWVEVMGRIAGVEIQA